VTAEGLGYGVGPDAVLAMTRDHDPLHVLLSGLFGKASPTMRWVGSGYREAAHPTRHDDAVGWEESLVLEVQKWLNTGEYGSTMRVLWWMGVDEKKLRSSLCDRLGREGQEPTG
jgi:hypothetical protein